VIDLEQPKGSILDQSNVIHCLVGVSFGVLDADRRLDSAKLDDISSILRVPKLDVGRVCEVSEVPLVSVEDDCKT